MPVLSGTAPVQPGAEAQKAAEALGYPVIVKASMGGGGRGMRVVETPEALDPALDQARREAQTAFGCPDVFLEKFIRQAKHIEVQLLGDQHGHLVHLYERDCSIQRRHQKIIEIAPAYNLDPALREAICDAALAIGRKVGYENAGTVEFLVDDETGTFYFIEVNPRIQVEHTVTEIVTGDRPRQEPDPDRPGPRAGRPGDRHRRRRTSVQAQGLRDPVPDHDRGPRPTSSPPTTAGSPTTARPAASASGSTAARRSPARSSRRSTTRCS